MCEQCVADTEELGEVAPGWLLVRARKDSERMHPGYFGLVEVNDPTFVFNITPVCDPSFEFTDEQLEQDNNWTAEDKTFWDIVEQIEPQLKCSPLTGYDLILACREVGYDPERHGNRFAAWLVHRMAVVVDAVTKSSSVVD